MTREDEIEIRMRYREAKDKRAQVDILCQMFETEEEEICRIVGIRSRKEDLERKREETLRFAKKGVPQREIARRLGLSEGRVRRWVQEEKR